MAKNIKAKDVVKGVFSTYAPVTINTVDSARSVANDVKTIGRRINTGMRQNMAQIDKSQPGRKAIALFNAAKDALKDGTYEVDTANDSMYDDYESYEKNFSLDDMTDDERASTSPEEVILRGNKGVAQSVIRASTAQLEGMSAASNKILNGTLKGIEASTKSINATIMYGTNILSTQIGVANTKLDAINANLATLIEYQNENTTKYYEKNLELMNSMIASVANLNAMNQGKGARDLKNFNTRNGFNLKEYLKRVKNGIKNSAMVSGAGMLTSMTSMAKQNPDIVSMGELIGQFAAMGLGYIPGINTKVNKLTKIDKRLGQYMDEALMRIGDKLGNNIFASLLGLDSLGNKRRQVGGIDMSNYMKEQIPWNGKAQRALTEVIPELLTSIDAGINNSEKRYYDYDQGYFKSRAELDKEFADQISTSISLEFSTMMDKLSQKFNMSGKSPEEIANAKKKMSSVVNDRIYNQGDLQSARQEMADILQEMNLSASEFSSAFINIETAINSVTESISEMYARVGSTDSVYRNINNRSGSSSKQAIGKNAFQTVRENRRNNSIFGMSMSQDIETTIDFIESNMKQDDPSYRLDQDNKRIIIEWIRAGKSDIEILRAVRNDYAKKNIFDKAKETGKKWFAKIRGKEYVPSSIPHIEDDDNLDLGKIGSAVDMRVMQAVYGINTKYDTKIYKGKSRTIKPEGNQVGAASSRATRDSGVTAGAGTGKKSKNEGTSYTPPVNNETEKLKNSVLDSASKGFSELIDADENTLDKVDKQREAAAGAVVDIGKKGSTSFGGAIKNLIDTVVLSMGSMITSFTSFGSRLFGKDGFIKNFFKSDTFKSGIKKVKDYLFNEKTGIFKDQVAAVKKWGKETWEKTKDKLTDAYDWVYDKYSVYKYGEDYREKDEWKNSKLMQTFDLKSRREAKKAKANEESTENDQLNQGKSSIPEVENAAEEVKSSVQEVASETPEVLKESVQKVADAGVDAADNLKSSTQNVTEALVGDTKEKPETLKKKYTKAFNDTIKKALPKVGAGAIIGAGVGMLNGFGGASLLGSLFLPTGLIGGAIVGGGLTILSQTEAFKSLMFGKKGKDGERSGGLISKELKEKFKKAAPIAVGGAVAGALKSIITAPLTGGGGLGILGMQLLPGGILGGAIMGMGIGLLKNNETFKSLLFGKKDEDGKRSGTWLSKSYEAMKKKMSGTAPYLKNALKGAGIGAITGAVMTQMGALPAAFAVGGPVGMGIMGLGMGIAASTKKFNTWLFGTEEFDDEGNSLGRKGGVLQRVKNLINVNVVEPISFAFKKNMLSMIDWTKDKITMPFRTAFGPIIDSIKGIKDNVVDFVKDKFETIGNGITDMLKKTLKTLFSPITKIIGGVGKALIGGAKIGLQVAAAPLTMGLGAMNFLTAGKRRKEYTEFYKNYYFNTSGNGGLGNTLRGYWDAKQADYDEEGKGRKVGFFDKISDTFQAITGQGEIAEMARTGYNQGMTENGQNTFNWRNVYQERKQMKNDAKKRKDAFAKWNEINKLGKSIANNDLGGREIELSDAKFKKYKDKFVKLGIDESLINDSSDLMDLIYRPSQFKKKAAGDTGRLGEFEALSKFRLTDEERAHMAETEVFHTNVEEYLKTIVEYNKQTADAVAFDRATTSYKEDREHDTKKLKKRLKNVYKTSLWGDTKPIDINDPELQEYDIEGLSEDDLKDYAASDFSDNNDFKGWLASIGRKMSPDSAKYSYATAKKSGGVWYKTAGKSSTQETPAKSDNKSGNVKNKTAGKSSTQETPAKSDNNNGADVQQEIPAKSDNKSGNVKNKTAGKSSTQETPAKSDNNNNGADIQHENAEIPKNKWGLINLDESMGMNSYDISQNTSTKSDNNNGADVQQKNAKMSKNKLGLVDFDESMFMSPYDIPQGTTTKSNNKSDVDIQQEIADTLKSQKDIAETQLSIAAGGKTNADKLLSKNSNGTLDAKTTSKFSIGGIFNNIFNRKTKASQLKAKADKEAAETAHATALGDETSETEEESNDVTINVEQEKEENKSIFSKIFGTIGSIFGTLGSTKIGSIIKTGVKVLGTVGLLGGLGLTIAELIKPGTADSIGAAITNWNKETLEAAKDGTFIDTIKTRISGWFGNIGTFMSEKVLSEDGYLVQGAQKVAEIMPSFLNNFLIPGIQRSASFIAENAETLVGAAGTVITAIAPPLAEAIATVMPSIIVSLGKGFWNGLWGKTASEKSDENLTETEKQEIVDTGGSYRTKLDTVTEDEAIIAAQNGQEVYQNSDGTWTVKNDYTVDSNVYVDKNGNDRKITNQSALSNVLSLGGRFGINALTGRGASNVKLLGAAGKGIARVGGAVLGGTMGILGGLPGMATGAITGWKTGGKITKGVSSFIKKLTGKAATEGAETIAKEGAETLITETGEVLTKNAAGRWINSSGKFVSNEVVNAAKAATTNAAKETSGNFLTNFIKKLTGKAATEATEEAGETVSKALLNAAGNTVGTGIDDIAKVAAKESDNFLQKIIKVIKEIPNNSAVKKVITRVSGDKADNVLKGISSWVDDFVKKLAGAATEMAKNTALGKRITKLISEKSAAAGVKSTASVSSALIADIAFVSIGAVTGAFDAANLFEVSKNQVDAKMRIISALLSGLLNTSIGSWVDIGMLVVELFTGFDVRKWCASLLYKYISFNPEESAEKLSSAQDELAIEAALYNQANGTNMSVSEYNDIANKTIGGKIIGFFTGSNINTSAYKEKAAEVMASGQYTKDANGNIKLNSGVSVGNGSGSVGYGPGINSQSDSAWANMPIGRFANGKISTMKTGGCGPTALSTIANMFGKGTINPGTVGAYAASNGYITDGGANEDLFTKGAAGLGLIGGKVSKSNFDKAVSNAPMAISGVNSGPFTKAGHVVVANGTDQNGNINIIDPIDGKSKKYSKSSIKSGMTNAWAYTNKTVGFGSSSTTTSISSDMAINSLEIIQTALSNIPQVMMTGLEAALSNIPKTVVEPVTVPIKYAVEAIGTIAKIISGTELSAAELAQSTNSTTMLSKMSSSIKDSLSSNSISTKSISATSLKTNTTKISGSSLISNIFKNIKTSISKLVGNGRGPIGFGTTQTDNLPKPDVTTTGAIIPSFVSTTPVLDALNNSLKVVTAASNGAPYTPEYVENATYNALTTMGLSDTDAKETASATVNEIWNKPVSQTNTSSTTSDTTGQTDSTTNTDTTGATITDETSTFDPISDLKDTFGSIPETLGGLISGFKKFGALASAILGVIKGEGNFTDLYAKYVNGLESSTATAASALCNIPAAAITETEEKNYIWNWLTTHGYSKIAAAGIMGCWEAESSNRAKTIEGYYLKSFPGYDAVLSSSQSLNNYTTDVLFPAYANSNPPINITKSAYVGPDNNYYPGFGYAQWTGPRGYNLLQYAKSSGLNWVAPEAQLGFFSNELAGSYSGTKSNLDASADVPTSTSVFFDGYEMGKGATSKYPDKYQKRLGYAKGFYEKYKDTVPYENDLTKTKSVTSTTGSKTTTNTTSTNTSSASTSSKTSTNTTTSSNTSFSGNRTGVSGGGRYSSVGNGYGAVVGYGPDDSSDNGPTNMTELMSGANSAINYLQGLATEWGILDSSSSVSTDTNTSGASVIDGTSTGSVLYDDSAWANNPSQNSLVAAMNSIRGKIKYSLDWDKQNPDTGAASCASTVAWAYRKVLGNSDSSVNNMSANSTEQSKHPSFTTIWTNNGSGLSTEFISKYLRPGDILYQNWDRTSNNGQMKHTEMYAGNSTDLSHGGPGLGPVEKPLTDYRRKHTMMIRRYNGFMQNSGYGNGPDPITKKNYMTLENNLFKEIHSDEYNTSKKPSAYGEGERVGFGSDTTLNTPSLDTRLDKILDIVSNWYLMSKNAQNNPNTVTTNNNTVVNNTAVNQQTPTETEKEAKPINTNIDKLAQRQKTFSRMYKINS